MFYFRIASSTFIINFSNIKYSSIFLYVAFR